MGELDKWLVLNQQIGGRVHCCRPTADDIEAHLLADPDLAYEVVARIYLRIVTPWKPSGVAGFMRELAFCDDSGIGAYAEDDEGKAKVDELLKRRGFVLAEEDHDG